MIIGSFWRSTIKERGALFPSSADEVEIGALELSHQALNALDGTINQKDHKFCMRRVTALKYEISQAHKSQPSVLTVASSEFMRKRRMEMKLGAPLAVAKFVEAFKRMNDYPQSTLYQD